MKQTEAFCVENIQRIIAGKKPTFKNKVLADLFKRAAEEVITKAGTNKVTVNGVTIYKKKSTKQYIIHIRWTPDERKKERPKR